jgi:hypothetical protein
LPPDGVRHAPTEDDLAQRGVVAAAALVEPVGGVGDDLDPVRPVGHAGDLERLAWPELFVVSPQPTSSVSWMASDWASPQALPSPVEPGFQLAPFTVRSMASVGARRNASLPLRTTSLSAPEQCVPGEVGEVPVAVAVAGVVLEGAGRGPADPLALRRHGRGPTRLLVSRRRDTASSSDGPRGQLLRRRFGICLPVPDLACDLIDERQQVWLMTRVECHGQLHGHVHEDRTTVEDSLQRQATLRSSTGSGAAYGRWTTLRTAMVRAVDAGTKATASPAATVL